MPGGADHGGALPACEDGLAIRLHWPGEPVGPKTDCREPVCLRHLILAFIHSPSTRAAILDHHKAEIDRQGRLVILHAGAEGRHIEAHRGLVRQLGEARTLG